jgi:hypothetical protein
MMREAILPLLSLVPVLVFPGTLVTRKLSPENLSSLTRILEEINTSFTHKDRTILYCVFVQFGAYSLDPRGGLGSLSFREVANWEFVDFAFTSRPEREKIQILSLASDSFCRMEGEAILLEGMSGCWDALLKKILEKVKFRYDIGLFEFYGMLGWKMPGGYTYTKERLRIVYNFCFGCIGATGGVKLLEFWYKKKGGEYE